MSFADRTMKTWIAEITHRLLPVLWRKDYGHMGYERIKPELRGVLTVTSARFVLQVGTEELLCSF